MSETHRRQGVASELYEEVAHLVNPTPELMLDIAESLTDAKAMHEAMGFRRCATIACKKRDAFTVNPPPNPNVRIRVGIYEKDAQLVEEGLHEIYHAPIRRGDFHEKDREQEGKVVMARHAADESLR